MPKNYPCIPRTSGWYRRCNKEKNLILNKLLSDEVEADNETASKTHISLPNCIATSHLLEVSDEDVSLEAATLELGNLEDCDQDGSSSSIECNLNYSLSKEADDYLLGCTPVETFSGNKDNNYCNKNPQNILHNQLSKWAIEHNISHSALKDLLKILLLN